MDRKEKIPLLSRLVGRLFGILPAGPFTFRPVRTAVEYLPLSRSPLDDFAAAIRTFLTDFFQIILFKVALRKL